MSTKWPLDDSVSAGGRVDPIALWRVITDNKWIVLVVTLLFTSAGTTYALLTPRWYRAEVLLLPATNDASSNLLSQFGGLASLAGINLGGSEDVEPLAVLKSRGFARSFIEEQGLMKVLLADKLDASGEGWKGPEKMWPDVRDAVKYFEEEVRRVVQDRKTGLVTLAVEWTDPVVAAQWANLMAEKINAQMRDRAIKEAQANVEFLRAEVAANNLVALQEPIGRLLELELQKLMLARSDNDYSFRVVDGAQVPKKPFRPQRFLVIAIAALIGVLAAIVGLLLRDALGAPGSAARRL